MFQTRHMPSSLTPLALIFDDFTWFILQICLTSRANLNKIIQIRQKVRIQILSFQINKENVEHYVYIKYHTVYAVYSLCLYLYLYFNKQLIKNWIKTIVYDWPRCNSISLTPKLREMHKAFVSERWIVWTYSFSLTVFTALPVSSFGVRNEEKLCRNFQNESRLCRSPRNSWFCCAQPTRTAGLGARWRAQWKTEWL